MRRRVVIGCDLLRRSRRMAAQALMPDHSMVDTDGNYRFKDDIHFVPSEPEPYYVPFVHAIRWLTRHIMRVFDVLATYPEPTPTIDPSNHRLVVVSYSIG